MGLSDDQRALLRLLAQREEGYDDIAALKGMSVDEVRAEVKAALAALETAEPPTPPPPPVAPAEVEQAPPAPAPPPPPAKAAPAPRKPIGRPTMQGIPVERRRFLALAGGALALVAIVIGLVALIGGDSGGGGAESGLAGGVDVNDERVTQAVLTAPEGGDASGRAIFGRLGQEEVVLQVTAEGLEPTPQGESYTVWLYRSPKLALRVGAVKVDADEGEVGARFPVPAELLAYIAGGAFKQIYMSRTSDAAYEREVAQAEEQEALPRYSGETVLSGEITGPIVEAGQRVRNGEKRNSNGNR